MCRFDNSISSHVSLLEISSQNRICAAVILATSSLILTLPIQTFLGLLSVLFFHSSPFCTYGQCLSMSIIIPYYWLSACSCWIVNQRIGRLPDRLWLPFSWIIAVSCSSPSSGNPSPSSLHSLCRSSKLSPVKRAVPLLIFWCQGQITRKFHFFNWFKKN